MSGRGRGNTRSSSTKKTRAVRNLEDFNSRSKNEMVVGKRKSAYRRDDENDDDGGGKKKRTTYPRKSSAHYGKDDEDFTPEGDEEEDEEEEEEYEEEVEEEEDDKNDPSFESPGKKKKQSSATSTTTKTKGSTTTSAKKRKEKKEEELKTTTKLLLDTPTAICIRYCIDDPKQPARKPRWGDCDGAYKKYFDWNLYTSNKDPDPYTQILNHFKKEMDDDIDCITKLMEYHSSFFFYDPGTKSSPYSLDEDDEYAWDTKSSASPITSGKELIKALALSGNLVEVELDNNNKNDNILDCGEGTDITDDDNGNSNGTGEIRTV